MSTDIQIIELNNDKIQLVRWAIRNASIPHSSIEMSKQELQDILPKLIELSQTTPANPS